MPRCLSVLNMTQAGLLYQLWVQAELWVQDL
jgi:hypothetical protein